MQWLPRCHRPVKNNKTIILNEYSDNSDAESEKVRKAKKSIKKKQATISGVVV